MRDRPLDFFNARIFGLAPPRSRRLPTTLRLDAGAKTRGALGPRDCPWQLIGDRLQFPK
jgi:hypothetical protein